MKRAIKAICSMLLVAVMTVGMYPMSSSAAIDPAEYCVPVLKSYTTSSGTWKPSENARFYIVVSSGESPDEELVEMMNTVVKEFVAEGYSCTTICYGVKEAARATDIIIQSGETGVPTSVKQGIREQSYKIEIGSRVTVTYKANIGAFYAFTTILQVLRYTSKAMPCGTIVDYPDTVTRAAQIDIARKYYTPNWLKNYIKELAWLKYNEITLHISEDQGMRLESKTYPGYAGSRLFQSSINKGKTDPDAGKFLTQEEMKGIVKTAFEYQVDVVPSFDSPGHMNYLLGTHYAKTGKNLGNSFNYNGSKYQPSIAEYRVRAIDLSNSDARNFALDFYKEFGKFFADLGCTKFNIGGDELFGWSTTTLGGQTFFITGGVSNTNYKSNWEANTHWASYAQNTLKISNGTAYDTFISYMNYVAEMLQNEYGYKTIRCFSDEIYHPAGAKNAHVSLNEDIEICFWTNATNYFAPFSTFTQNNRTLLNCIEDNSYYVLTVNDDYSKKSFDTLHPALKNGGETIYNSWNGSTFYDTYNTSSTKNTLAVTSDKNAGSVFFIWCDSPWVETENDVYNNVKPLIRSFAAKMWSSNAQNGLSYNEFKTVYNAIGQAPLYNKTVNVDKIEAIRADVSSKVTLNYYQKDTTVKIKASETKSGYSGDAYSFGTVPDIDGYIFVSQTDSLSGTLGQTDKEINLYYYKRVKTNVTVNYYKAGTNEKIKTSLVLSDYANEPYSVSVPSITNYAYSHCDGELTGTFTDGNQTINLYYVSIDKSSLQDYVDHFIPSYFAQSGYDGYLEAWYDAKQVLSKSAPTQEEIDTAINGLKNVINDMKRSQVCITVEYYSVDGKMIHEASKVYAEAASYYNITTTVNAVTNELGRGVRYTVGSQMGYISATPITVTIVYA